MEITQEIYRSFFDHTNDMIQAVGPDGRFRFVNPRWQEIMGYTSAEVTQLQFEDILRPDQIAHCRSLFTALQKGWHWEHVETVFINKAGQEIYVEGNISAQMVSGKETVSLAVFRNVNESIHIETQLRTSLERTQALYEIARSITDYEKLPHLLQIVTDSVAKTLPADRVILYTFDMEKETVVHFVKGGPSADKVVCYTFQESMEALSGWVLRHQKPALALKEREDERVSPLVYQRRQELDIGSVIVVPVQYQEQIKGTLTAINGLNDPNFNEQDAELMRALGNQAALALENVRLYEAEQRRARELQAQNEELDAFAHTVAHDLKSPLSNLMGFADLLLIEEGINETVHMYGDYIYKSGQKMINIIDELLLLSQVRRADVKPMPLDMARIVQEVRKRLHHHLEDYQAELIVPEQWPLVLGYGSWVEEMWVNYISNAIKYGGRPPRVELRAVTLPDNFVKFQVIDNGVGVSPEAQSSLFTPFERLEQVGKIEGYGLGLSIVRRIAEKLGGEVGVESEPGEGSVFFFTLPLA